jgi:hypothetical protein
MAQPFWLAKPQSIVPEYSVSQQHHTPVDELPLLNARPRISVVPIFDGHLCVIVDDFMRDPTELVDYAVRNHALFQDDVRNYYPGPELPLGGAFAARLRDAFLQYARAPLKARRVHRMMSRLSLVTRRPDEVLPAQRLPHRDMDGLPEGEGAAAMVLYLFKDERFGGTSFFRPRMPMEEITALMQELKRRELAGEAPPSDLPSTYAIESSRYFEKVLTIAPRYNRAIFYDGRLFHSGDLHTPGLMVNDPLTGRLTVNAGFLVRMTAT